METFEIGGEYKNRSGNYQVMDIKGNDMTILQHGETKVVNKTIQERILKNIELEEFNKTPMGQINFKNSLTNEDVYKVIGYLAKNGAIFVELIDDYKNDFFEKYRDVTDNEVDKDSKYIIWRDKNKLWTAPSIRVHKNEKNSHMIFNLDVPVYESNTHYIIYKTDFIWYIMEIGFRIGTDHNMDEIYESIPDNYKEIFLDAIKLF